MLLEPTKKSGFGAAVEVIILSLTVSVPFVLVYLTANYNLIQSRAGKGR